jgi:hypothetical protein
MTTVSEEITATGIVAVVRLEHYDRALEIEAERVEKAVDPVGLPAMPTQEDLFGPEGVVKQLSAALIERCLQGELTTHLGYEKSQRAQEARPNQRNGDAQKTLKSDAGELEIAIPRDREGSYDPLLVKRGQRILTGLSEKILWLYAHGLSTRDIQAQILNWSGVEVSPLGDLVVIQWFEAEKSGLHFIGLTKYGDQLLDDADLPLIGHEGDVAEDTEEEEDERFFVETNLTTSPVFSPDGRFILFCWQRSQHWWTDVPDDVYVEGDLPARVWGVPRRLRANYRRGDEHDAQCRPFRQCAAGLATNLRR